MHYPWLCLITYSKGTQIELGWSSMRPNYVVPVLLREKFCI